MGGEEAKQRWLSKFADALAEQIDQAVSMGEEDTAGAIDAFQSLEWRFYKLPLVWSKEHACALLNLDYATLRPKQ